VARDEPHGVTARIAAGAARQVLAPIAPGQRPRSGCARTGPLRERGRGPGGQRASRCAARARHVGEGALLDGDAQRADCAAALAALGGAVPVTVAWGTADRIVPAAQARSVTGAACRLIDGAGRMPHLERPAKVQAAIEETIAGAGQAGDRQATTPRTC